MLKTILNYIKINFPPSSLILKFYGLQNYNSVLDIASGKHSVLSVFDNKYKVGIEIYEEYINISKKSKIHHEYILGDVTKMNLDEILPKFEAVILFDLVEHLTEKECDDLIKKIESYSNIKFVAVKTPSTYIDQDEYDGNIYQSHKSFINPEFFRRKGYTILGSDGPRFLYLENNRMKEKQSAINSILSLILRPIYTFIPSYSLNYLAILKR
jgi:cyclopropane fatty-acyl-phospholipid synthase-like methyltransferase